MSFNDLGLMPSLLKSISAKGYNQPSPIQKKAIPLILQGKDVMGGAQTGTGKTAAFALPVLQLLDRQNRREHCPRALVLTPTRELAAQIHSNFAEFGSQLHLKSEAIYGGVNINPQIQALQRGVDIIVACPGRLLDLANRRNVDLSRIEILILDEADRMLDMGFIHDIRKVLSYLPAKRQSLLFSATYSNDIQQFAQKILHQPTLVEVAKKNEAASKVIQSVFPVARSQKRNLLSHLIKSRSWNQALVFTRTKHGANKLAEQLTKEGIHADAIHSNKSQTARARSLDRFKNNRIQILVATDIAARGIDIERLPYVVNFDLPTVPEDYIHRIGRTGRAGETGNAISLVTPDERNLLFQIEKMLGKNIKRETSKEHQSDLFETPNTSSPSPIPIANRERRGQRNASNKVRSRRRTNRNASIQKSA